MFFFLFEVICALHRLNYNLKRWNFMRKKEVKLQLMISVSANMHLYESNVCVFYSKDCNFEIYC